MAKNLTVYVCSECGTVSPKWVGKCPNCGAWNTFIEEPIKEEVKVKSRPVKNAVHQMLSEIKEENFKRIKSGIEELDRVLGGGIVPDSMVLIGGEPGIGKSTLLTEVAGSIAKEHKVLYVSAEESASQLKMRATRLNVNSDNLFVMNENCLEDIEASIGDAEFLIIDSIQAIYLDEMSSSAGSVGQVKECAARLMRIAKSNHVTVFIIGHVTKEGNIAGPKVLEHIMDTVLYFESETEGNYRILRAVKNRFGSVNEVGVFEMRDDGIFGVKDYSGIFVSENRGSEAGAVVTPFVSGNRCVPVEIQSLVSRTVFGNPRRMSLGIDYNKMILMIAVLEKKAGIPFYNQDVYVNAMSGIKLTEPSIDLALILALASGENGIPVPATTAAFGEVGLTGEVRGVNLAEKRVKECINLKIKRVIIPKYNYKSLEKFNNSIELVPVSSVKEAVKKVFDVK